MMWKSKKSGSKSSASLSNAKRRKLSAEPLEQRLVLDSTVVFNELMYNPPGDTDDTTEWIELFNQLAVDMDVSDWRLEGGVEYTFPDGTIVPGRGFLLVAASTGRAGEGLENAPSDVQIVGPFDGRLSNGGERVELYNNDGRLMNTINYNDRGDWPTEPDGSGATLAKRNELTASEDFESWTFSPEVGGTPGVSNFIVDEVSGGPAFIEITPDNPPVQAFVPTQNIGLGWTQPAFNDSAWRSGNAGVGYENGSGYQSFINLDVTDEMDDENTSIYIRQDFQSNLDVDDIGSLFVQLRYDDGFIAYLNGTEVARDNAPTNASWNASATGLHDDAEAVSFVEFDITANKNLLVDGNNVLAIHGLNDNIGSSDFLISPKLSYLPVVTDNGETNDGSIPLAISEISPSGNRFIEFINQGSNSIELDGMTLTLTGDNGADYTFPTQSLAPGARLTLNEAQLGATIEDGEHAFLYSADGNTVVDGRAITGRLRGLSTDGQWIYPDVATPGTANSFDLNTDIVINEILYHHQPNFATDTTPFSDSDEEWLELYNRGNTAVSLAGWELDDGIRFEFPAGTVLAPNSYIVVSNDPATLSQKFPGVNIVGPFDGKLSNTNDRIVLQDAFENPVDVVKYYESGQWDPVADGGGSSLELTNPFSDNSIGGAWAASDESGKSTWNSYSGTKRSDEPLDLGTLFHEFIFGTLESGELLIDNLSVRRDGFTEVISGGDFENVAVGALPGPWRFIGNHGNDSRVVTDPDDPNNKVLHLVADGAQQFVHDHVEVTFANGQTIQDGRNYTVSFDAKWVNGSRQLNTRLYFTRASQTFVIDAPTDNGTPGARNSTYVANAGPTFDNFAHAPIVPSQNEPVTVTVDATDPQGVASMDLYYGFNGTTFTRVPMTLSGGQYRAIIPGQSSGQIVQFYVEGTDNNGAVSTFPAEGEDSRALYQVADNRSTTRPIESFRIVMMDIEHNDMFASQNRMSNNYLGATLIIGEHTALYDVEVRLIGSRFIRPNSGYKIKLGADQLYHGVHETLRFDINQLDEILMKQMVNRAAGSEVSMYDDIAFSITRQHGGRIMLLNLARYESTYLSEQFGDDGTDGTKFELDDVTFPTNGNRPNNEKTGTGVSSPDIENRGTDPEAYRGHVLIKNNRAKDDFETIAEFARVINLSGTSLSAQVGNVLDEDLWMRHYATQSYLGNWDTYGFRRPKNLRLYIRPDDGKVIPLFWDADLGNYNEPFIYNGGSSRLDDIRNLPRNTRLFWGHMWDLTNRSFNGSYAGDWISHYNSLGVSTTSLNTINSRTSDARASAIRAIPQVDFEITTNNGNPTEVNTTSVNLVGDGWIDVREIRLPGSDQPLDVTWTDTNSWSLGIPLSNGQNSITLEAYDFEGNRIGTDTIVVNSTALTQPVTDVLRITELNFNPSDPTAAEQALAPNAENDSFEFIEFTNTGQAPVDLTGVSISEPIQFSFPSMSLQPGQRTVVVRDQTAFGARYPGIVTAGEWGADNGGLSNGGESVRVLDADGVTVQSFDYDDSGNWPSLADGDGYTLQVVDTNGDYSDPLNWTPSTSTNGDPGADGATTVSQFGLRITEVNYNPAEGSGVEFVEIYNDSGSAIPLTGVRFVEGIEFDFTGSDITTLQPGEHALVVGDVAEFNAFYGDGLPVAGAFTTTSLSNGGERIVLFDVLGNTIHDFVYDDAAPWDSAADGNGPSLEINDVTEDYSDATNWRVSTVDGGTPGTSTFTPTLICDYTGGRNGCDLDDLDVLYANSGSGVASVSVTSLGVQSTFRGSVAPIPASSVAADSSLEGGFTFDLFVDTDADILLVDGALTVTVGSYYNNTAGIGSDTEPPMAPFTALFPELLVDSWVTTPSQTAVAGINQLDEDGTKISHFDSLDDGPQDNFQFARITLLPDANGQLQGTFSGLMQTFQSPRPVIDSYSFEFTVGAPGNEFDFNGDGTVDNADIPGWLEQASRADNLANGNNNTFVIGDVNLDGSVNSTDLGLLLNNFGDVASSPATGVGWRGGDIDMSGTVNSTDLGLLLNNFGFTSVAATAASASIVSTLPEDTNGDGVVSPIDALQILNYMNASSTAGQSSQDASAVDMALLDVDGDGEVAPIDALMVVNRLNQNADSTPTDIDSFYAELEEEQDEDESAFDKLDILS